MIPHIIHQLWIGDQSKRPVKLMQSWKDNNPRCKYVLWTEDTLKLLKFENQKQVDLMTELNGKCDIMRWEILYKFGGFFADADSLCVNELDDFFFDNEIFACYENEDECQKLVAMGFVGCEPGNGLFRLAIDGLHTVDKIVGDAWMICGPQYFTNLINAHPEFPVKIYPSYYFIPEHGWNGYKYKGDGKIYSHHYGGSTFGIYGELE